MPRTKREYPVVEDQPAEENPLDAFPSDTEAEDSEEGVATQEMVSEGSPAPWESPEDAWNRGKRELKEKLAQPVPKNAIRQVRGSGNRMYDYVDTAYVIRKLNELFGVDCSTIVREVHIENSCVWAVVEVATPYGHKQDVGTNSIQGDGAQALDTAIKGAVSDALKRAARQYGEALGMSVYPDVTATPQAAPTPAQSYVPEGGNHGFVPPQQQSVAQNATGGVVKCDVCGTVIKAFGDPGNEVTPERWAEISRSKFGMTLCRKHYNEKKYGK